MSEKVNNHLMISCNICNKYYASQSSLCNHNKKFHQNNINNNKNKQNIVTESNGLLSKSNGKITDSNGTLNCKYCNKIFKSKQNKYEHQKKVCEPKFLSKENIELEQIKLENEKLDKENKQKELEIILKKEEAKILQLKLKLQQADKVDNITLNKLNKMLLKHNNRIKNSTVNSHNTQNIQNIQNVNNNFQLVGFGKEEITELLTNNEKKLIMNSKYGCLEKLIEIVHCGKYNQFKNVILTNMKDNYMYKYDDVKGCFVLGTKSEIMNSLVDGKLFDLDVIYNDLLEKNKIDEKTKNCIEDFVNRIHNNDEKFTDIEGKQHEDYKHYKISEIKLLLFNNQDKITNDISLLLSM
jgi:hypothetical protein